MLTIDLACCLEVFGAVSASLWADGQLVGARTLFRGDHESQHGEIEYAVEWQRLVAHGTGRDPGLVSVSDLYYGRENWAGRLLDPPPLEPKILDDDAIARSVRIVKALEAASLPIPAMDAYLALCALLGEEVETPRGTGTVWQVFHDQVRVNVGGRALAFGLAEIRMLDVAAA